MNTISAAVTLGQIERVEEIVGRRKLIGNMFWKLPMGMTGLFLSSHQKVMNIHITHFSVDYRGEARFGITWKDFYNEYKVWGDGFYSPVAIPYTEPPLIGRKIGDFISIMDYVLSPKIFKKKE